MTQKIENGRQRRDMVEINYSHIISFLFNKGVINKNWLNNNWLIKLEK